MSNFAAMTVALDAIYGALEAPRKDLSSSTETDAPADAHTEAKDLIAQEEEIAYTASPVERRSADSWANDKLPREGSGSPAQFNCTACKDKGGYYERTDGYRNFDPCCYCAPVDPVRDILADDFEI